MVIRNYISAFVLLLVQQISFGQATNVLNTTGNGGIGTTNPGYGAWTGNYLHILNSTSHSRVYLDGGNNAGSGLGLASSGALKWYLGSNGHTNGNLFTIGKAAGIESYYPYFSIDHTSGNVGIGTITPNSKLVISTPNNVAPLNIINSSNYDAQLASIGLSSNNPAFSLFNSNATSTVRFDTYGSSYINGGNVGIGTNNPYSRLMVSGGEMLIDYTTGGSSNGAALRFATNANQSFMMSNAYWNGAGKYARAGGSSYINFDITSSTSAGDISFYTAPAGTADQVVSFSERMRLTQGGSLAIGTVDPQGYKLAVNGAAIFTKAVIKSYGAWPDYVFNDSYELRSLEDVEKYIQEKKHLPDVPSAQDVANKGVDIGAVQAQLLKKIEELTLYVIELKKEMNEMRKEIPKKKFQNPNSKAANSKF